MSNYKSRVSNKLSVWLVLSYFMFMPSLAKAYTVNSLHGNLTYCDTMTRGIFIVWWDKDFNYASTASLVLDSMLAYRTSCLTNLNLQDPLNAINGYYCNIYIHTPGNTSDYFTVNYPSWGNGVGGDANGYPFMTLPTFVLEPNYAGGRWRNLAHEAFHIFQSHGMWNITPGIYNTNDGEWFVEASANWFSYNRYPNDLKSFIESTILVNTPHVPLWLNRQNFPIYYPNNWQRQVHQYALATYLYYLTHNAGVADSALVGVFYSGTTLTPQEFLYNQLGGTAMCTYFIDAAAHMTNGFDFLLPAQHTAAQNEWNTYASSTDNNQFIQTYTNTGTGTWFQPADSITTHAWSFNTYKLLNTLTQSYTFELNGNATGTYGDNAHFQGKIVLQNSVTGTSYHTLIMNNAYQGALTLNLTPTDTAAYFIIASMPPVFKDVNPMFQLFPYQMRISNGATAIHETTPSTEPLIEMARYNLFGQRIQPNTPGFQLIVYTNGSTKKVLHQ